MQKLDQATIDQRLSDLPDWAQSGENLQRTFNFRDFREAMAFVKRVAELAEEQSHHPDILIRYNKVTLTLSTHEAGGITDRDFSLAEACGDFAPAS